MAIERARYTAVAIALHWLMALLLIGLFTLGHYMTDLPVSPWKLKVYAWHKWAGVTVFLLVWLRLVWRLTHRPPALPATMPPYLRLAARGSHALLYGLMMVIPLSGWLMSSAKGFQTVYFGVLPIPDALPKNQALGDLLLTLHQGLNWLLAGVVLVHLGAALKHHLIDQDDVLVRMLPRWRIRSGTR